MDGDTKAAVEKLHRDSPYAAKSRRKPRALKKDKLSSDQVRRNHVVSEQRRRELVRAIYDDLVEIVPDLQTSERRSEILIYTKTINHLKWLYNKNSYLRKMLAKKYEDQGKPAVELPNRLVWELQSVSPLGANTDEKEVQDKQ